MTENNVIGPISPKVWKTIIMLRRSIKWYREQRDPQYSKALDKEIRWLEGYMETALTNKAA